MHHITQTERMLCLQAVKDGETIPASEKYVLMLFELSDEGLITIKPGGISLSYFGFRTLEDWDPILGVSTNDQLAQTPYGYA